MVDRSARLAIIVLALLGANMAAAAAAPTTSPAPFRQCGHRRCRRAPIGRARRRLARGPRCRPPTEFCVADRSYSPARACDASHRLQRLRERTGRLDDVQIAAELARIAALAGNAHTRLYVLRNRGHWRRYPLRLWRFADGWRVVAAQGEASTLLGGRLTARRRPPGRHGLRRLRPLFAGKRQLGARTWAATP
jgi:hypothetical protein